MAHKSSSEIRQEFFDFFKKKEHLIVDSAPVVPQNDPTLLFTNAGMNQFKSIFLGEQPGVKEAGKIWTRAADTQKCIRVSGKHNDLEEVGHDTYHHTLFEMLGNWSFGDYFKKEAIGWAWELLVDEWGLDPDRLYATVFGGDDADGLPVDEEAIDLWKSETSIAPSHILKFGKKDNFWEMGETGPCGPCSEIHVDLRTDEERKKQDGAELVNMDDPRVMEIWNLVFIQFNRKSDGSLHSLPAKHVDTGMGFERICAVLQGKTSNYDSDVFTPLLTKISEIAGITYGNDEQKDIATRVIADHIRAVSFSIADGASPGNDGRGYVIRRILRRAIRYGWDSLNLKKPFMYKLVDTLSDQFGDVFPELRAQGDYLKNVIEAEEKSFLKTLGQGIALFNEMAEGNKNISGSDAFKLHDTYGFPIDLTELMARERGLTVDSAGFEKEMKQQKERARAAGKFGSDQGDLDQWTILTDAGDSNFVGYDELSVETKIAGYRKEKKKNAIILETTPFYAESGGQIADTGVISNDQESLKVLSVQKRDGRFIHYVDKLPENFEGNWIAQVDASRRQEIQKHHSVTHLAHEALRRVLGDHVAQKGSLVEPDRLRFDFSHFEAVSKDALNEVEIMVNQKIQENIPLTEEREVPIAEAKKRGAMMLFGEKYGDKVRVITFDPNYSSELCGGTHVKATGEIGYFRFVGESSVAAGIRRIEAVAGRAADDVLRSEKQLLDRVKAAIGQSDDPASDIEKLITQKKALEKELDELRKHNAGQQLESVLNNAVNVDDKFNLITGEIPGADMDTLKDLGYDVLNRNTEKTVVVLGARDEENGKAYLMAAVSEDMIKAGVKAGALVGSLAKLIGGGGGGQPNLATAGGRKPEDLQKALDAAKDTVLGFLL